jgi:hypothetical protein
MRQLGLCTLGLGVAAPCAAQRAGFEKNGRPDAGAIVHAETLDIEHDAGWFVDL